MMNVYACGGCAVNIGKKINPNSCNVVYVDTSVSNSKQINPEQFFLVGGSDGAGKLRNTTYVNFQDVKNSVLIKHKPSDINIVMSSLAGGSGSVIAPMLVSSLLEMGKNVIVIGVDSTQSTIEITNTINTLKTYKAISLKNNKSIGLFYLDNKVRRDSDDKAIWFVNLINLIIDKTRTEEFDISDLSNFINFDRVTDNKPNVTFIEVNHNEPFVPSKNTLIVSTIHVSVDSQVSISSPVPEYLATCIITDPTAVENLNARIDNVLGGLSIQLDALDNLLLGLNENKIVNNKIQDVENIKANDDGMVL